MRKCELCGREYFSNDKRQKFCGLSCAGASRAKSATSQYYGVSAFRNKWRALITVGGVQRHIGVYPTEEAAARAYDREARKFGKIHFNFEGEE